MPAIAHNGTRTVDMSDDRTQTVGVVRERSGLFAQLSAGNMNPGLGTKVLSGTDISYARSRGGARLFFRNADGGIQIVGKANESSVINHVVGLYGR